MPLGTNLKGGKAMESETVTDDDMSKAWKEHECCARLEQELVRNRWTFFTAMLSVSFVVGGLTLSQLGALGPLLGKAGFSFGYLIFLSGVYHYVWFHRICHKLRDRLCQLETKLGITVYIIRRERPKLDGKELYYHWAIDLLALAYTIILILVLVQ
jgi:hypothetical protein